MIVRSVDGGSRGATRVDPFGDHGRWVCRGRSSSPASVRDPRSAGGTWLRGGWGSPTITRQFRNWP